MTQARTNKIILALDTNDLNFAIDVAKKIKNKIFTIKLGLEFFNEHGKSGVKKFNDLGINSIKDLDKFFDAVYDQAKLSKPKDQMTVAHGGRITKALGGRSRDI